MRRDEQMLIQEAKALALRVRQMEFFEMRMPMVGAASVSRDAARAVFIHIHKMREDLIYRLNRFIHRILNKQGGPVRTENLQRKLTAIKLRFVSALFGYDMFADVLTQRAEHKTGVWLAGLDAAAEDALRLPFGYKTPPAVCYLERGLGAAIRRAKTGLPGGRQNPTAVIRIPRERMVGFGISSSLVHEVGHQAEMLLGLSGELKPAIRQQAERMPSPARLAWRYFAQWTTEILADSWGISLLGIAAPRGLMSVLSLPKPFLFRMKKGDPHPMPWIRAKICLKIGDALYPHPQWEAWAARWERMYPPPAHIRGDANLLQILEAQTAPFLDYFLEFRPRSLQGRPLGRLLRKSRRTPDRLREDFVRYQSRPDMLERLRPTHALAVLGQAFADNRISAENDSRAVRRLLSFWALQKNSGEPVHSSAIYPRAKAPSTDAFAHE